MTVKSSENVEVNNTETEIIEPTDTDKNENRTFSVENGDKQIIASAWGLDDNQTWQVEDSKPILPNDTGILVVGPTHMPRVKLTARTTMVTDISIVSATLTYSEP
jgi:hypothetical protein